MEEEFAAQALFGLAQVCRHLPRWSKWLMSVISFYALMNEGFFYVII